MTDIKINALKKCISELEWKDPFKKIIINNETGFYKYADYNPSLIMWDIECVIEKVDFMSDTDIIEFANILLLLVNDTDFFEYKEELENCISILTEINPDMTLFLYFD